MKSVKKGFCALLNELLCFRLKGFKWYTWFIFGGLLLILLLLQPFIWFQFLWTKYKGFEEPRNKNLRKIYDISARIIKSAMIRTGLYVLISVGLAATSVVNVIGIEEVELSVDVTALTDCISSWVGKNDIKLPIQLIFVLDCKLYI